MNFRLLMILLFITVEEIGCAIYSPPPPVPPGNIRKEYLAHVSRPSLTEDYDNLPDQTPAEKQRKVASRNRILSELIWLVDGNYLNFEQRFFAAQAYINLAGDTATVGLTGVSAVTGSAHLKSVLSAIATGTTGIKTSIDKNYVDQQTRAAMVVKMRSGRELRRAILLEGMKKGSAEYTLAQGLVDIQGYYEAGSLIGALQSISAHSGEEQGEAKAKLKSLSETPQAY